MGSIHCVHACACRGQGTSRVSWFSPSIFVWVLGVTLRLPGLWSHLLNCLSGPDLCLRPTLRYASTVAGLMTAKSEAGHRDRLWRIMMPVSLQPSFWSCGEWWHRAMPHMRVTESPFQWHCTFSVYKLHVYQNIQNDSWNVGILHNSYECEASGKQFQAPETARCSTSGSRSPWRCQGHRRDHTKGRNHGEDMADTLQLQ